MSDAVPAIQISQLVLRRGEVTILDGIDFTLPRGSTCALLGPNGSGKTTLVRAITGYMWPTTGTVEVFGERLGRTDMRVLRRRIAVINPSERFGLDPNLPAIDAVLTGYFAALWLYEEVTSEQRDRAEALLKGVGLGHRLTHKFGLLSTGEQRRCLMARALVSLPELLILDEPTAGLDLPGRERLLATIARLRLEHPQLTILMVTHHAEEIAPNTDRVLMLQAGRVAADGPPDRVITPEMLSHVFGCKVFVQKRSGRWWVEVLPEAWIDLLRGV